MVAPIGNEKKGGIRWASPLDGGRLGSPHTIEIPFASDNVKTSRLTKDAPNVPVLAEKVSDAWIAFARTGDPNMPKLPHWPAFDAVKRPTMAFDNESVLANDPIRDQCLAMFAALGLAT